MKKLKLYIVCLLTVLYSTSYANNLQITDFAVNSAGTQVTFKIAWDNSWYFDDAPDNWDAVWIFLKSYDCEVPVNATWAHVPLSTNSANHSVAGTVLKVDAVSDGMGVFVRRATAGTSGNITPTEVTLRLANSYNTSAVSFEIQGIEMVSVLEGPFYVGGYPGEQTTSASNEAHHSFRSTKIESEDGIAAGTLRTVGSEVGSAWFPSHPIIINDFPKGYDKFYIMKYQITQGQYVAFLNLLTFAQQTNRAYRPSVVNNNGLYPTNNNYIYNRNAIKMKTIGSDPIPYEYACNLNNNGVFDEDGDGMELACNFLSWNDVLAYLDWAALRPMTELEYEKACRGPLNPVAGEYAWGNANITQAASNRLTNSGRATEISNDAATLPAGDGLAAYGYTSGGPLRVGFAAMATTHRIDAGASYWGAMDLSGNLWEQTMSVGFKNTNINTFDGSLGDGSLASNGENDQASWGSSAYGIIRGGSWYDGKDLSKVGSRYYVGTTSYLSGNSRYAQSGGRGVRQF